MRILGDTSHMASACCAHRLQLRKLMTVSHAELAYVLRMDRMDRDCVWNEHFGYLRGFLTRTAAKSVQLY